MRITRLLLGRYGHLSDCVLEFPAAPGLHIVLGANEAGKSTALAAIGDGLFGFPHRTPFAFLHSPRDLRIGLSLRAADGREASFIRRKGRKQDLTDVLDEPLPESAIAAFLGGAARDRFYRVFGLDAAELRRGGQAILNGEGEVGEAILEAHTGLRGFRALVERLGHDAAALAGDRRGRRALHEAVDAFKAARQALDERVVEPAAYQEAREARQRLRAAQAANRQEADGLHAERTQLERILRTAPARRVLARALPERASMGPVPRLPPDALSRHEAALAARARAEHDLRREQARDAELQAALSAIVVDVPVLDEGEAIDALAADLNRIAAARRDRAELRSVAEQRRGAVETAGRQLGLTLDAETLAGRIPDALTRDAAGRAINAFVRLAARAAKAREDRQAGRLRLEEAEATLASLPEPPPGEALHEAIEQTKAEGRIDEILAAAQAASAEAAAELARLLAALPLWSDTAEALAVAPLPLDAEIIERGAALEAAEATERDARATLAEQDRALAAIEAALRGETARGEPPTEEAIAVSRERRDRAWRLIRRHRLDGGAAPTPEELEGLPSGPSLEPAFESLLREADGLADRRASETTRVVAVEQLRSRQAEARARRVEVSTALTVAEAGSADRRAAWRALWAKLGIEAQAPAVMREWQRRREAVLTALGRARQAAAGLADTRARHQAAHAALAALLPQEAAEAGDTVAPLLRAANRMARTREEQEAARSKAAALADAARTASASAARACDTVGEELTAWRVGWATHAAALGLAADAPAESGTLALELWSRVEAEARAWRDAHNRIADISLAVDSFVAEAAAIARRVAPQLAEAECLDAVRALAGRLATARADATRHAELTAARRQQHETIATLRQHHDEADAALAALRGLAGVDDDAALQAAIARAAAHATLSAEIAAREAELMSLGDGLALAELEAEAAGVDPDALPGRIAAIGERLRLIGGENEAYAGKLAGLGATLEAMEGGHDAAGAAQAMRDAVAEAQDIAGRYVRLRLAQTLLRAGIDRFRREQQAPLLSRASQLFARLTEGRYDRLSVDAGEDDRCVILALRPDDTHCPAERLSEGTRDQLYLALRLAAIEGEAGANEPLPFIADDLLVNFDDRRARAALRVLAEFARTTQTILFTHHAHIADMAEPGLASLHTLPATEMLVAAQ